MSTVPARRRRTLTTVAILALAMTAALLALGTGLLTTLGTGLLTIGSSLSGAIASAELSAGAALQSGTGWMLPALFTAMVAVAMVIAVHLIGGRRGSRPANARVRTSDDEPATAVPFELRAPDRAAAEATRGLFRTIGS